LAGAPEVEPKELDVVLVPGVSFDKRGGRLGFGGGFYDRLLIRTPAARIGVTYDCCLVEELPCAEHDQRMDWVVTPTQAIRCGPLWRQACSLGVTSFSA
jgi:5-formyltetrahydrofolate cyclo-ligase